MVVLCAAAVVGLAGCSSDSNESSDLGGRTFVTQELVIDNIATPAADGGSVSLTFTDDGISVNAGCNTLFGSATWTGGVISVEGETLASTMMACSDALMDQDQLLSTFFTSDPSWTLSGNELSLTNGSITMSLTERLTEE